jgi:hypothetical protein
MLEEDLGRFRERLADLLAEVDAIIEGIEDARRRAAEAKAACQRGPGDVHAARCVFGRVAASGRLYPPSCPSSRHDVEIRDDDGAEEQAG